VLLEEQDRAQWDHATAASVEATDWPQVRALHGIWYAQTGNPVVLLNRATNTAERDLLQRRLEA
jgi:predicted RNA polymerase sigma factor